MPLTRILPREQGAGYAFLNMLSDAQLERFGRHVGSLLKEYGGSHVVDTYVRVTRSRLSRVAVSLT